MSAAKRHMTPVFLLADQHREAVYRIQQTLHSEWMYVPVTDPRLVIPYAIRLSPTAIFLADPTIYPRGGTEALLRKLLSRAPIPVVILVELWTPKTAEEWKRRGASDCLPHPTRVMRRLDHLRQRMQEFAFEEFSKDPGPPRRPPPLGAG